MWPTWPAGSTTISSMSQGPSVRLPLVMVSRCRQVCAAAGVPRNALNTSLTGSSSGGIRSSRWATPHERRQYGLGDGVHIGQLGPGEVPVVDQRPSDLHGEMARVGVLFLSLNLLGDPVTRCTYDSHRHCQAGLLRFGRVRLRPTILEPTAISLIAAAF